jgi:hypothetical protein
MGAPKESGVSRSASNGLRRGAVLLGASVTAAALLFVGVAFASSGGSAPSNAPGLAAGSHPFSSCNGISYELWALPGLTNGDQVSLDVNGDESGIGSSDHISILPPSADDYNWQNATDVPSTDTTGNDTERVTFNAAEGDGRYLIHVYCYDGDNAYDFVVESILHIVRANFVPRPSAIPFRGSISGVVVNGDGAGLTAAIPFTLYVSISGTTYHSTSTASPSAGRVVFSYALPKAWRGKRASVWIAAPASASYVAASTAHVTVVVR